MLNGMGTRWCAEPNKGALQQMWNSINDNQTLELEVWLGVGGALGGPPASRAPEGRTAADAAMGEVLAISLKSKREAGCGLTPRARGRKGSGPRPTRRGRRRGAAPSVLLQARRAHGVTNQTARRGEEGHREGRH